MEDIPELETDEENWDDGQFDDAELLNHHNSTEESDRICHEYSAYFEKVDDQEYSPYNTTQGIEYQMPKPDYYNADHDHNSTRDINTKMFIYLPLHPSKTYVHGMVEDVEEPGIWSCIATGCMGRKPGHSKAD